MKNFDLIIMGGGAGAFAAAIRANDLKAKTAMVNSGLPLGGTCVNVGCVPSKRLLRAGEVLHLAQNHKIPGVEVEVKNIDFQTLIEDELHLVSQMRKEKYEKVLGALESVSLLEGYAKFISQNEIRVNEETVNVSFKKSEARILYDTTTVAEDQLVASIEKAGYRVAEKS